MPTTNDHTGDTMRSRRSTEKYKDEWGLIFGKKKKKDEDKE